MNATTKSIVIFAYLCAAAIAAAYIAAGLFFLLNKTMPTEITIDTWYRYWTAYSSDPTQSKRLIGAAIAALATTFGAPLAALAHTLRARRSLHGDARWATESEIRKAGLL